MVAKIDVQPATVVGDSHEDGNFFPLFDGRGHQLFHAVAKPLTLGHLMMGVAMAHPQESPVGLAIGQQGFLSAPPRDLDVRDALADKELVCLEGFAYDQVGRIDLPFGHGLAHEAIGVPFGVYRPSRAFGCVVVSHAKPNAPFHWNETTVAPAGSLFTRGRRLEIAR